MEIERDKSLGNTGVPQYKIICIMEHTHTHTHTHARARDSAREP